LIHVLRPALFQQGSGRFFFSIGNFRYGSSSLTIQRLNWLNPFGQQAYTSLLSPADVEEFSSTEYRLFLLTLLRDDFEAFVQLFTL